MVLCPCGLLSHGKCAPKTAYAQLSPSAWRKFVRDLPRMEPYVISTILNVNMRWDADSQRNVSRIVAVILSFRYRTPAIKRAMSWIVIVYSSSRRIMRGCPVHDSVAIVDETRDEDVWIRVCSRLFCSSLTRSVLASDDWITGYCSLSKIKHSDLNEICGVRWSPESVP